LQISQQFLNRILEEKRKSLLSELFVYGDKQDNSYIVAFRQHVFLFKDTYEEKNTTIGKILSTLASIWKTNPTVTDDYFVQQHYKFDNSKIVLEKLQSLVKDIFVGKILENEQTLYIYNFGDYDGVHSPYVQQILRQLNIDNVIDETIGIDNVNFISKEDMKNFPDIGFHGTSSNHLTSILRHGILKNMTSNYEKVIHTDYIFFSTRTITAFKHAIRTAKLKNSTPIVIEFRITDKSKVLQDYDVERYTGIKDKFDYIKKDDTKEAISDKPFSLSKNKGIYSLVGSVKPQHIEAVWIPEKQSKYYFSDDFIRVEPKQALLKLNLFH